ncbi:MAG: prephenate dehydrogenase dimerization domain-containing protein [Mucilaginibacter sp.]
MKKQVAILGINGGFGALFSRLLSAEEGLAITGVDLNNSVYQHSSCYRYLPSDVGMFSEELKLVVSSSDIIIVCLPEVAAYNFFNLYQSFISKQALLIDTLSIKADVAAIYIENDFNALSLNPMFGPDLPMEGKNIIVIKFKESARSEWFISLLKTWMLHIVYATSEEHDKISSIIQVATHAAVIAFGITLNSADHSISELLKVSTPPFLSLSALYGRIISGKKNVYWNIQKENAYASAIRKTLINNMVALDKSIDEDREDDFNALIDPKDPDQKEIFLKLADHFFSQLKDKKLDL